MRPAGQLSRKADNSFFRKTQRLHESLPYFRAARRNNGTYKAVTDGKQNHNQFTKGNTTMSIRQSKTITKSDILESLELMDIKKGDVLLMHSALSSMGAVKGGSDTVILKPRINTCT